MDLNTLKLTVESQIGYKARLIYKAIVGPSRNNVRQKVVWVIHIDINAICFHKALEKTITCLQKGHIRIQIWKENDFPP